MNLNVEYHLPEDHPARLVDWFVENMNLNCLYDQFSRLRKDSVDPKTMLKLILFTGMRGITSTRAIEAECLDSLGCLYLLQGQKAPDHSTIARFRSEHLAGVAYDLIKANTELLLEIGEIDTECVFIDGTKIEANANRYTFVWRKAVSKNMQKRSDRLAQLLEDCEKRYGIKVTRQRECELLLKDAVFVQEELRERMERENIKPVYGRGHRKTQIQKDLEALSEHIEKITDYAVKIDTCGARNSFSKTDPDATFMRMKEDHMRNGQTKPGYNLQHGVNSEYVVFLDIFQNPTDNRTLIPFLRTLEECLGFTFKKIVADAGYESEENYAYLNENDLEPFIKPGNYEIAKKRKYKNDIGRIENMEYDEEHDVYICAEGKQLVFSGLRKDKTQSGYISEKRLYSCQDCSECSRKKECIKSHAKKPLEERNKNLTDARKFNEYRKQSNENIQSGEGILLRTNRSIQVEGSFALLKEDLGHRRFKCRGIDMVRIESVLIAISTNIKKLYHRILTGRMGMHLFPLKEAV